MAATGTSAQGRVAGTTLFRGVTVEMIPHRFPWSALHPNVLVGCSSSHVAISHQNCYCSPVSNLPSRGCQRLSPENLSALHVVYSLRTHASATLGHLPFCEPATTKSNPPSAYAVPLAKNTEPHLYWKPATRGIPNSTDPRKPSLIFKSELGALTSKLPRRFLSIILSFLQH